MSRATYFDAMDPALSLAGALQPKQAGDAGEGNPNHDPSTGQFSSGGGGGGSKGDPAREGRIAAGFKGSTPGEQGQIAARSEKTTHPAHATTAAQYAKPSTTAAKPKTPQIAAPAGSTPMGFKPRTTPKERTGSWVTKTSASGQTYKEYVKQPSAEEAGKAERERRQRFASNLSNASILNRK